MDVKIKKMHEKGVMRVHGMGEIKEIGVEENILDTDKTKVMIYFRGERSSGILELTQKEADNLSKTIKEKAKLVKKVKLIK